MGAVVVRGECRTFNVEGVPVEQVVVAPLVGELSVQFSLVASSRLDVGNDRDGLRSTTLFRRRIRFEFLVPLGVHWSVQLLIGHVMAFQLERREDLKNVLTTH